LGFGGPHPLGLEPAGQPIGPVVAGRQAQPRLPAPSPEAAHTTPQPLGLGSLGCGRLMDAWVVCGSSRMRWGEPFSRCCRPSSLIPRAAGPGSRTGRCWARSSMWCGPDHPDFTLDDRPLFIQGALCKPQVAQVASWRQSRNVLEEGREIPPDGLLAAARLPPAEATWALRRRGRRRGRRGRPSAWSGRRWCPWPSAAPSRCSARPRPGPPRPRGTARTSR
jgi:hypothetical protein